MMYIHNSASLRGVWTSYITQLRFVMYDISFTHLSFASGEQKTLFTLYQCDNSILLLKRNVNIVLIPCSSI